MVEQILAQQEFKPYGLFFTVCLIVVPALVVFLVVRFFLKNRKNQEQIREQMFKLEVELEQIRKEAEKKQQKT